MLEISPRAIDNKARVATTDETKVLKYWSNEKTFDKNIIDLSISLKKPEKWVSKTIFAYWRYNLIPKSIFNTSDRNTKREIYKRFLSLVKKAKFDYIEYVGLCGIYAPILYEQYRDKEIHKYGIDNFTIIEKNPIVVKYLECLYQPKVSELGYPGLHIINQDILEYLHEGHFNNIIDLDLMCHLSIELIDKIIVPHYYSDKVALALNTSYGHGLTKEHYYKQLQPYLLGKIKEHYFILEYTYGNYCDRQVPMAYEYFTLLRKN